MIDLRSDTVTRPTPEMLEAMQRAEVGDDVFHEDPTINALEDKAAKLLGKEAALFCPSGTMTNQIAINVQTEPGDEVICEKTSHIRNFEGGGMAVHSGVSAKMEEGDRGRLSPNQIERNINAENDHLTQTSMVAVENTSNMGGGSFYDLATLREIGNICQTKGLTYHLDGARLFNAVVASGNEPSTLVASFDSISICLSKGLGAPVGSLLIGSKELIKKGRRKRKVLGGGMRQAGYLAAAGIYALDNSIDRLQEDHDRARELGEMIQGLPYVKSMLPVDTNIIVFELEDNYPSEKFLKDLEAKKIKAVPFGPQRIRMVMHLDVDDEMLDEVVEGLKGLVVE